jgi:hypothetical protein
MIENPPSGDQAPASAAQLQILATEHWSLLATRSLTYSESFTRAGMFFTVLTGALVSLALLAQVEHFGQAFRGAALLILSIVFFIGLATIGRLSALNKEDVRWLAGMNRLRHAYLDMHPSLEPYFITDSHDDMRGIFVTMGIGTLPGANFIGDLGHGLTTLPAVMGITVALVAGVLGALVAGMLDASEWMAIAVGAVVFLIMNVILSELSRRSFFKFVIAQPVHFPTKS